MADTSLILHVKGTESETAVLPRNVVRHGIFEGKITHSQLIWIPGENTWKPVKELPELLPGEMLILHVKGTEAETQELPKAEVLAAVLQGKITHSQLIWVPAENMWKPVRELPDLLPGERLILHVKGTEAQTTELPRRAIKTALSKGELTHSQLIWSPHEHAWKQVREIPELLPSQKLAPAPTREALQATPRIVDGIIPDSPNNPVARAVAASGDVPQVRVAAVASSHPAVHVAGSPPKVIPKVATAVPQVRGAEAPAAKAVSVAAQVPVVTAAQVPVAGAAAVPAASGPQVRAATALPKAAAARSAKPGKVEAKAKAQAPVDHKVKVDDSYHPMKWLCIGLGIVLAIVVIVNYFLVDMPLTSDLAKTKYSNVGVYGHLGAFMQPNVLVIHVPASAAVTPETLTDFLVALAHSTRNSPFSSEPFTRVALTSGWTAQYSFSGYSWKELGDMASASDSDRKEEIMTRMGDASGQSILPESTMNDRAQATQREIIWAAFVNRFTGDH